MCRVLGTQGHGKSMWGGIKVWWKDQYKWSGLGGISRFFDIFLWVYDVNKYLEVFLCFFCKHLQFATLFDGDLQLKMDLLLLFS
jgi:hypothetical protein